jgi:hypothetical protein
MLMDANSPHTSSCRSAELVKRGDKFLPLWVQQHEISCEESSASFHIPCIFFFPAKY